MNTTTMAKLHLELLAVTAERDHWKANHDNRVNAAKILMDRTDMPLERVGAYKHYVAALEANQNLRERAESAEAELLAVREDNHSMMLEIHNLRIERDALAAELAKLRAAPAVPDWNVNIERIRDVMHMLGISIDESVECFSAALPTNINRMTQAMKRHLQKLAGMTAEAFEINRMSRLIAADPKMNAPAAAQQAATAPSVADCRTCANRGRTNGLSQESYCDSCVYEGRDWRQDHFVDAREMVDAGKRRCEACAVLPCSCK